MAKRRFHEQHIERGLRAAGTEIEHGHLLPVDAG
jgi:hypothetical protein